MEVRWRLGSGGGGGSGSGSGSSGGTATTSGGTNNNNIGSCSRYMCGSGTLIVVINNSILLLPVHHVSPACDSETGLLDDNAFSWGIHYVMLGLVFRKCQWQVAAGGSVRNAKKKTNQHKQQTTNTHHRNKTKSCKCC